MYHPETASKKKKKKGKRVKQAVIIQSTSTNNQTQSFIYTKIKLEWIKKKPPKKAHNHCMSVILLPPSPLFSGSMASRISPEPAILIGPMYETKASQMQSNAMISLPTFLSTYHGHIFWDILAFALLLGPNTPSHLLFLAHSHAHAHAHACIRLSNMSPAVVVIVMIKSATQQL